MRGSTVRTEDQLIPREDSTFPLLPTPRDSCVLPLSPLTYRGVLRPLATCIYIYICIYSTSQAFSSRAIPHATWTKFTVGQIAGNKRLEDWNRIPIQRMEIRRWEEIYLSLG